MSNRKPDPDRTPALADGAPIATGQLGGVMAHWAQSIQTASAMREAMLNRLLDWQRTHVEASIKVTTDLADCTKRCLSARDAETHRTLQTTYATTLFEAVAERQEALAKLMVELATAATAATTNTNTNKS